MESRGRARRWPWGVVVPLVLVWLAACTVFLVLPRTDTPTATDATFFLSSDGGHEAIETRPDLRIGQVVVSRPASVASWSVFTVCDEPGIICVTPAPETTQGEAEAFARLAEERDWTSVTVVSQTSHVTRTRILMGRCFPGTVRVVAIPERGPLIWVWRFVYETGAMVKTAVTPGCHDRLPWER